MNKSIIKFLEFNGKTLLFLSKDGTYWIAIKPVCEVLNVNYNRQFQNIKEHPIIGPVFAIQQMRVPGDQTRNMACLPEMYIYGWIMSIKSDSPELLEYQKECYKILFDYFHGTITSRKELIQQKAKIQIDRKSLEKELNGDDRFKNLQTLKASEARIGIEMKRIDQEELETQLNMFVN